MSAPDPILDVQHLAVTFRGPPAVRAIDDVSLAVAPGEVLGVVGESGSGKTLTAMAVMDLLPRRSTQVSAERLRFAGRDLTAASARERRALCGNRIAMVFQDPMSAMTPYLRIGVQVTEALRHGGNLGRREARVAAAELLVRVGIAEPELRLRAHPHELSGGTLQRIVLAMAVAARPALLFADEPTTALDATVQDEVLDLLQELQREQGMALVVIAHDLGVVAGMADRVLVLYAGRVAEEAPVETLFAAPAHPYTRALLRASPRLDQPAHRPVGIPGRPVRPEERPDGCAFAPRCPDAHARCSAPPPRVTVAEGHAAHCWALEDGS